MTLTDLTLAQARAGLRARDFSARELTQSFLSAIEMVNPKLNAYLKLHAAEIKQFTEPQELIPGVEFFRHVQIQIRG